MVHAQGIVPTEQVLSQLAPEGQKLPVANRQPTTSPAISSPAASPVRKAESVSPFEADRARKVRGPEPEMSDGPKAQAVGTAVAIEAPENSEDPSRILGYVLNELENAGHKTRASGLETGRVVLTGDG